MEKFFFPDSFLLTGNSQKISFNTVYFSVWGLVFCFCNKRVEKFWEAGDRSYEMGDENFLCCPESGIHPKKKMNYFFHLNMGIMGFKRSGSSSNTDNLDDSENCFPFSLL